MERKQKFPWKMQKEFSRIFAEPNHHHDEWLQLNFNMKEFKQQFNIVRVQQWIIITFVFSFFNSKNFVKWTIIFPKSYLSYIYYDTCCYVHSHMNYLCIALIQKLSLRILTVVVPAQKKKTASLSNFVRYVCYVGYGRHKPHILYSVIRNSATISESI